MHVDALIKQAMAQSRKQNLRTALSLLQQAERLTVNEPELAAKVHLQMAKVYSQANQNESVIRLIDKAIEETPWLVSDVEQFCEELNDNGKSGLARQIKRRLKQTSTTEYSSAPKKHIAAQRKVIAIAGVTAVAVFVFFLFTFTVGIFPFGGRATTRRTSQIAGQLDRIEENVANLFVVLDIYDPDLDERLKFPLPIGSCFAVSQDGYLLTSKHITQHFTSLDEMDMVLDAEMLAIFGTTAADRYLVDIIHEFPAHDIALIKIDKSFRKPFNTYAGEISLADDVYASGFPGKASDMVMGLDDKEVRKNIYDEIRSLQREGEADFFNIYSEEIFSSTLTRGIVSAVREVDGTEWVQTDASIHRGNSGGPLLNGEGHIIAVNTVKHVASDSVNLSISLRQLAEDISRWASIRER